jgi:integrase
MPDKSIVVWVQHFADRPCLMLQWHDPLTGKRKSKSAETCNPLDAERRRADLEYELNHGLYQEPSRMTWEAFRKTCEEEYLAARRQNTRRNYRVTFDLFERICNPKNLGSITERTISTFAAGLHKAKGYGSEGMMASTIKIRLQALSAALAWAVRQKLLAAAPSFPTVKVPKKKPQAVPTETFERLLEKAKSDPAMYAFLLCGWLGGLRLNEAIALEREETDKAPWVDFARDRIVLPAGVVKAVEDQWVPLDPVLRSALEELPSHGRKFFRFVAQDGHRIGSVAVSHRVVALAKAARVKLTMRALRRGFGCRYAGKVPAQVLQKLMRHSNIRVTMDYYANVDEAAMEAVLGAQRNSSRNSQRVVAESEPSRKEESPFPGETCG